MQIGRTCSRVIASEIIRKTLSSSINNSEKEKQWNRFSSSRSAQCHSKARIRVTDRRYAEGEKVKRKNFQFPWAEETKRKSRAQEDEVKCKMIFLSHPNMTEITAKTTRRRWKFKLRFMDCSKLNSRQQADVVKCSLNGCREQIIKIIMKWRARRGRKWNNFEYVNRWKSGRQQTRINFRLFDKWNYVYSEGLLKWEL